MGETMKNVIHRKKRSYFILFLVFILALPACNLTPWSTATSSGTSETSSTTDSDTGNSTGTSTQIEDEGNIETLEETDKSADREEFGSYSLLKYSYFYNRNEYDYRCEYTFPDDVDVYLGDETLDFENESGELVWQAELNDDDSFEFTAHFLNQFGDEYIPLECSCEIYGNEDDDEDDEYTEEIRCNCEPLNDDRDCSVFYRLEEA